MNRAKISWILIVAFLLAMAGVAYVVTMHQKSEEIKQEGAANKARQR